MSPQCIAFYPESTADEAFLDLYLDYPIKKGSNNQPEAMSYIPLTIPRPPGLACLAVYNFNIVLFAE